MSREKAYLAGYFTVEATLVLPIVFGVILLVMYMFFYKYDRCLMEEDYSMALIEGIYGQEMKSEERIDFITHKIKNMYRDEYYAWDWGNETVSGEQGKVTVQGEGSIRFPFPGLKFWNGGDIWSANVSYKGSVIKKMFGIRTFRKLEGILK